MIKQDLQHWFDNLSLERVNETLEKCKGVQNETTE